MSNPIPTSVDDMPSDGYMRKLLGADDLPRLSTERAREFATALSGLSALLGDATHRVPLDRDQALRLMASTVAVLADVAVELLGGAPERAQPPRERQLSPFPDHDPTAARKSP